MYRVAEDANPAAHRLVLALLLALVLHLTLLLTVPLRGRAITPGRTAHDRETGCRCRNRRSA